MHIAVLIQPQSTIGFNLMSMTDYYNPIWDAARQALPDRMFEDEQIVIASTFECGNGYRIQRLDNGRSCRPY